MSDERPDDLTDLEPLGELPPDATLEELHEDPVTAGPPEAPSPVAGLPAAAAELGQKRELEQAPILLRKASRILLVGSLLPWLVAVQSSQIDWVPLYAAKVLGLLAGWVFHQGYLATHGGKPVDVLGKLAKTHRLVLPVLAGVIAAVALAWPVATGMTSAWAAVAEVATLLLASATFSHIFGYEHGGKFNPIFPLMFLGPGIAGLLGALNAFQNHPLGGIGSLVVGIGGLMAIYVMFVAMKQAKIEGDKKRVAMREHRKAQRAASRGTSRGAGDAGGDAGGTISRGSR